MKILGTRWAVVDQEGHLLHLNGLRVFADDYAKQERAWRKNYNKSRGERKYGRVYVREVSIVEGDLTQEGK